MVSLLGVVGCGDGEACEHQAFSWLSSGRFWFKLPLTGTQFSLLNFSESFTPNGKLVSQAFNAARSAGWGRGREEFKGLQLYNLSLPLGVSTLPLSAYMCV